MGCNVENNAIYLVHEVERSADYSNFAKDSMTQFKLPTTLVNHLEQEIYEKLTSAVELRELEWTGKWTAREQRGETFHTYKQFNRRGEEVEKKVNWYKHVGGLLQITFFKKDYYGDQINDYYRPMTCTTDYAACRENAKAQTRHSVGLLESRINGHLAVTDKITDINLALGNGYFIEGFVTGTTEKGEEFKIYTKMIWNYRYGANSANGYLTQYVQFRSDRRGARQEGKTVLQRATELEIQAKKDAKQAELVSKNEAKWERFAKLPDQIDRWADKEIKKLSKELSPEGIQAAKERTEARFHGVTFDKDWYVKNLTEELEVVKHYKKQVQAYLNNEPAVRDLFGLDCNNREHFKAAIW